MMGDVIEDEANEREIRRIRRARLAATDDWCDDCHGYTHMPYCPSYRAADEISDTGETDERWRVDPYASCDIILDSATQAVEHLTPAELDALLEAARAATPGPWYYKHPFSVAIDDDSNPSFMRRMLIQLPERVQPLSDTEATQCERDYRYLAAANPATITHLVLMVRELQERLRVKPEIEAVALSGIKEGIRQREQNAVEHFRVRAVRAIKSKYGLMNHDYFAELIESLPLVETEDDNAV